jgi:hypothetical protein
MWSESNATYSDDAFQQRIDAIHSAVSVRDLLQAHGVKFKYSSDRRENFSCPFHGRDAKPSVTYFPSTDDRPAHAWCYVCREQWDAISLYKKLNGFEGGFGKLLFTIEREYGLETPKQVSRDHPTFRRQKAGPHDHLFEIAERRMKSAVGAIRLDDWARLSVVLDRIYDLPPKDQGPLLKSFLEKLETKCLGA